MPLDSRNISENLQEESLGSLGACLVEGDPEQRNRERRVRRRSLTISILVQTAVLALLMLLPLFGKPQRIALAIATPIPPYGHPHRSLGTTKPRPEPYSNPGNPYIFRTPTNRPISTSNTEEGPVGPPNIDSQGIEGESGPECSWCVNIGGKNSGPWPPQPVAGPVPTPRVVRITTIDPAMLIHRVEPVYPPLPKQIHKEGRVELRAIIATDGSIQSLEVVGGDPMFFQSALEAVRQWHYKPTILNGQAVEIDTHITVIYTIQHY